MRQKCLPGWMRNNPRNLRSMNNSLSSGRLLLFQKRRSKFFLPGRMSGWEDEQPVEDAKNLYAVQGDYFSVDFPQEEAAGDRYMLASCIINGITASTGYIGPFLSSRKFRAGFPELPGIGYRLITGLHDIGCSQQYNGLFDSLMSGSSERLVLGPKG